MLDTHESLCTVSCVCVCDPDLPTKCVSFVSRVPVLHCTAMDLSACLFATCSVILRSACLPCHLLVLLIAAMCRRPRRAPPSHVCITGAASGMGRGLALFYASQAATRCLSLTDINESELEVTRLLCQEKFRRCMPADTLIVNTVRVDVCDAAAMREFIVRSETPPLPPLDLVLCVAGVIESRVGGGRALDDLELGLRALVAVNILGTANTALPALEIMRRRGHGQVGILGSLASLDGLNALYPAYAASKSFITMWALGLRAHLTGSGVTLNVFAPGAVATPLLASPPGIDPHYDPSTFAPAWVVHSPCVELGVEAAAAAWAAGLARDEAITRPHRCYALVCAEPCVECPLDARDLLVRWRCYMLWGWRPSMHPRHAWLAGPVSLASVEAQGCGSCAPVTEGATACDAVTKNGHTTALEDAIAATGSLRAPINSGVNEVVISMPRPGGHAKEG
jgi:NAD(P)-dependent dehydrogenase (short-subunit alcohol dehydrogenase family)